MNNKTTKNDLDLRTDIQQDVADLGILSGVETEEEEIHEFPFDAEMISISSVPVPISRLLERLESNTISSPEIQRSSNLWSIQQESRLIESLMLRIPLPLFYVAADNDENWKIVDGLQRVSALKKFLIDNKKLLKLEFLNEFNGKCYKDLPIKYKNRIMDTTLQFAVISSTTPPEVQRNVFKRLNTGGLPLSPQEIRHALYYDKKVAELLQELASSDEFIISTDSSVNDSRMAAKELALRFIAFLIRDIDSYPKNDDMDSFLSDTMLLLSAMPKMEKRELKKIFYPRDISYHCKYSDFKTIKDKFILGMKRSFILFGVYSFRKSLPGTRRTPINKALFETIAVTLCEMEDNNFNNLVNNKNLLFARINYDLATSLEHTISRDSHKIASIKKRFNYFRTIFQKYGEA